MHDTDEPLAYTIGDQPFLGLKIYLDSRPLIPRPETEWWVNELVCQLEDVSQRDGARHSKFSAENYVCPKDGTPTRRFLDLCAGSGAIGCAALARLPDAQVYFGEIDPAHESTILKNIHENNLDASRAHICIGDLFDPFPADLKFDVIATNPPYIPIDRELPASVADYEPALALRSGIDGLELIRRIATTARRRLAVNGVLWCECDSAHAATACALFAEQGFDAEILNDQYGEPRVICAKVI